MEKGFANSHCPPWGHVHAGGPTMFHKEPNDLDEVSL